MTLFRRVLAAWDAVIADHERLSSQSDPVPSPGPLGRRERRWFREQGSLAGSFGNPDAARLASLRVLGVDPKADAGLGPTGRRP